MFKQTNVLQVLSEQSLVNPEQPIKPDAVPGHAYQVGNSFQVTSVLQVNSRDIDFE